MLLIHVRSQAHREEKMPSESDLPLNTSVVPFPPHTRRKLSPDHPLLLEISPVLRKRDCFFTALPAVILIKHLRDVDFEMFTFEENWRCQVRLMVFRYNIFRITDYRKLFSDESLNT